MTTAEPAAHGSPARNAGLDLLRAVAISLVLTAHFGALFSAHASAAVQLFIQSLGFFGVELFFVLSGFLIGRLLFDICARGVTFRAWRIFMLRRAMRTMPAYFVCLAVLLIFLPPTAPATALYFATFTQNLAWPFPQFWFGVTWSLTIEEWFYLLFSIAFLGLSRLVGRRALPVALAIFLLVPVLIRLCVPLDLPWDDNVRKIVVTRLDAIAYGVLAAWLVGRSKTIRRHATLLMALGLALLVMVEYLRLLEAQLDAESLFWRTSIFNFTSIGFVLIIPQALRFHASGVVMRAVLKLSVLAYALYLVHLEILLLALPWANNGLIVDTALAMATLALSFLTAIALHRLVEKPFMQWRPAQSS